MKELTWTHNPTDMINTCWDRFGDERGYVVQTYKPNKPGDGTPFIGLLVMPGRLRRVCKERTKELAIGHVETEIPIDQ